MFKFLPYVLKTLWRHRSRTLLTVSGSAVALFVFCLVEAMHEGLASLQQRQASQRSLIAFQAHKFCPATSHLPQDYDRRIAQLPGVSDVVPIQVYTNNCRASLDVIVFQGVPAEKVRAVRDFQLTAGSWREFEGRRDAAIVGQAVAARRNLHVGDKFSIGGLSVQVAGVFRSSDPAEETYIYTHLEFLQRRHATSLVGTVTQIEVLLADGVDPTAKCQEIDSLFRGGPVGTDTRPKGVFQALALGDLRQLLDGARVLACACVGLVLAMVASTTFMSVEDRVQEHAVLQTIGCSGWRVFQLVASESVVLSIAGGAAGVAAAWAVLALSGLSIGAEAVTVAFTPSLRLVWLGLSVSLAAGVLAGIVPAWRAASADIVSAWRRR